MPVPTGVVVIGGGVIGLSIAYHLAMREIPVSVVDATFSGQASRAAAGMLAPLGEAEAAGPFVELGLASLRRYPEFLARLSAETGQEIALSGPGMLRVAETDDEAERLCRALSWQRQTGLPLEWLEGAAVRHLEPAVSPCIQAAVRAPEERSIEPRRLLAALQTACVRRGVHLHSGAAARGLTVAADRVTGVETADAVLPCDTLVVAGGAWSAEMARWLDRPPLPIVPVRGQMLALGPERPRPVRHTIYTHSGYLVPRDDGRIAVGATEEHAGFDTRTTAAGLSSLLHAAARLAPCLAESPVDSFWTGLRPVSPDGLPLLGPLPGWNNVHLAAGHGRNGILLTPLTGALIADSLMTGAALPAACDPARFEAHR